MRNTILLNWFQDLPPEHGEGAQSSHVLEELPLDNTQGNPPTAHQGKGLLQATLQAC